MLFPSGETAPCTPYPTLWTKVVSALRNSGFAALASQIVVAPERLSVSPYTIFGPGGSGPGDVGTAVGVPGLGGVTVARGVGKVVGVPGGVGV